MVGEALLVGRKLNPSNQGFGKWCREMGFGDMDAQTRSDAMWWASYRGGNTIPSDMTHPKNIRQWDREQQTTAVLPADLQSITTEKVETVELDQRSAERVAKVINRAKSGDEGSEVAKRHVEALAKKHGTTGSARIASGPC